MKRNKTILQLPFEGEWFVGWGGDTKKLNHHHDVPNQKYAFDFIILDEKNKSHQKRGTNNKDYYCFGKKILAPASGVIIETLDGIRDNKPGIMNKNFYTGNLIMIKHNEKEISFLCHFKQGSIKVKVGDKVKKGQLLGLCGNSGNSSEPHLHYHLQDNEIIRDGKGIKCYFRNIKVKKKEKEELKKEYSPIKNDFVSSQT